MNKKLLFLALTLSFSTTCALAQRITGRVVDAASNEPLPGATILEKGTANGAATDLDGQFSIELKDATTAILVARFVGFDEKEEAVAGRSSVEIRLGENETLLNQVVVVGYGTQRKSDLTGSVGSVKAKDLERLPVANVEQALQGKVAGVYVAPTSGEPGAGAVIRIRGTGSLNNSAPIYVVDGMILSDATFVNPQDIASVEILKDASACAIYGARGANGVVIITTKNGRNRADGDAQISLTSYAGSQAVTRRIALANGEEFARLYNEFKGQDYFKDPSAFGEGTDWQDEIFQPAPISNISLNATGGSARHSFAIGGGFFQQDGIVKNSHYERLSLRFNNEMRLKSWFSLGSNLSLTKRKVLQTAGNSINGAYRMPPIFAPLDSTGDYSDPTFFGLAIANPAADLFYKKNNTGKGLRGIGNVFAELRPLRGLTLRSNFGFDFNQGQGRYFEPKYQVSPSQLNKADRLSVNFGKSEDWIWEQTATFDHDFGQKHHLNLLAGFTAEERTGEFFGGSRENFPGTAEELLFLSAGNDTTQMNFHEGSDEALISYLFRANYSFLSRYLCTFSMRADQSSRFQRGNRTGIFPAVGLGWTVSNEPFFEKIFSRNELVDRLKLRASVGILGNQNSTTGRYPTVAAVRGGLYGVFGAGENLNYGATLVTLANRNLKWETTRQTDLGLEVGLFKNRLEIEVDWYRRHTFDIIAAVPIPDYVGSADDPVVNTAEVENKGWDITANWRSGAADSRFLWNLGGTFSPVENQVLKLADGKEAIFAAVLQGEPATRTAVGLPIGSFFGYEVAGVFQDANEVAMLPKFGNEKPGDLRFNDLDGNGKIDGDDRTFLGSPIPNLIWGLNAGIQFAGFDLSADLFGVRGNKVFNAKKTFRFAVYNWEKSAVDGWTKDKPSATEPRVTSGGVNYRVSDFFLEDGSFTRLRSVAVGYSLPKSWLGRAKISKFRIYGSLTNWLTWQKFSGYSPEFANGGNSYEVGFDFGGYPVAKSWQVGAELVF